LKLAPEAAYTFADAARANPRVVNRYVRNASALSPEGGQVGVPEAQEVVIDLNGTTLDGLTQGMVAMLRYLLSQPRTVRGEVVYQSGVGAIATALGHSRDTKAVALYVEPYLIERGLLQVMPNGRRLTEAGVERALAL
jgi:Holliday junction resolvasome RuvABC ATP-dependent DNA helicase subunit